MKIRRRIEASLTSGQNENQPSAGGKVILILTALLAFTLNHSMRSSGFNFSLADLFLMFLLITLVSSRHLFVLRYAIVFFALVICVTVTTTLWITPTIFGVSGNTLTVGGDIAKLTVSFLYFVVGCSLARLGLHRVALKWFAIAAACVALLGLAMEVSGYRVLESTFYYGGIRYRGLMADPNFYAVLACAGIAYFAHFPRRHRAVGWAISVILASSVILSGSKTGIIVLIVLIASLVVNRVTISRKFGLAVLFTLTTTLLIAFLRPILGGLTRISNQLSESVPQLHRLTAFLTESPLDAIAADGSSRDAMWTVGLEIFERSPFFGTGVGTYNDVAQTNFGQRGVAHNTYIQLIAEWGVFLALTLFIWIAILIVRAMRQSRQRTCAPELLVLSNIVIVFCVGSVALSLNNARMFWFFLGITAFLCYRMASERQHLSRDQREPRGFGANDMKVGNDKDSACTNRPNPSGEDEGEATNPHYARRRL